MTVPPTTPISANLSLSPSAECFSPPLSQAQRAERLWPTAKAVGWPELVNDQARVSGRQTPCAPSNTSVAPTGLAHNAYALSHGFRHGPQSAARRLTGSEGRVDVKLALMPTTTAPPPAEEGSHFHGSEGSLQFMIGNEFRTELPRSFAALRMTAPNKRRPA